MITIEGRKMGKSYNNVIKLTEMFSGNHPLLAKAYHPMVIRFFILQTHYRSTLDFSNDALLAAEKGLKRLWDAYEKLQALKSENEAAADKELEAKILSLLNGFEEAINDDFGTARVLANMFELVPVINSMHDKTIATTAIGSYHADTVAAENERLCRNHFWIERHKRSRQ
jgi:cysteinyl-tRNA synthetase